MSVADPARIVIGSRCSWTLHNFRLRLIQELMGQGYRVTAIGGGGDGYDKRLLSAGVDFRDVPLSRKGIAPLADLLLFFSLYRLFRREEPMIFHAFTIKPAIYGTLAAAAAGVPVRVVTITGLGHAFTTASGLVRRMVEFLYRTALRRATRVYFQNNDDRALFLQRGLVTSAKVRMVAGSGVDTGKFAVQPLPAAAGGRLRFLMIARLLREKGVFEYFAAAQILRQEYPDVQITLLGGLDSRNPSALSRADLDSLTAGGAVRWLDEVSDVRPHIAASDVLVLPSYREGLPRSILEGASMGRAAIVTDVPGCRDAVDSGVTGVIVPPADPDALAKAMKQLMNDPAKVIRMGAAARARVEARFDERAVILETTSAYRELALRA